MNIAYCEQCSAKVDGEPIIDPSTSAQYCKTCAEKIPHLANALNSPQAPRTKISSRRLPAVRKTPAGGVPLPAKSPASGTPTQPAPPAVPPPAFTQAGGNMAFYFCESCGRRLNAVDLEEGRARNKQVKGVYCVDCAKGVNTVTFDAISMKDAKNLRREYNLGDAPETAGSLAAQHSGRAHQKPARKSRSEFGAWVVGAGAGVAALFALAVFALRDKPPSGEPVAAAAPAQPAATAKTASSPPAADLPGRVATPLPEAAAAPAQPPAPSNATISATPGGLGLLANAQAVDDSVYNARAAALLKEAQDWYGQNSGDAWSYKDKLEQISLSYRSSPSGQEARKILAELKLPPESERTQERINWHRDWNTNATREVVFHAEYDGRPFVLQTHPLAPGRPCQTTKALAVPELRPWLELRMRGNDVGDHRHVVSVDGRELMSEIVGGKEWRSFVFDLTPLRGKTVEVSLIHHNTGWYSEHAYLQIPRFVDKPASNSKVFSWNAASMVELPKAPASNAAGAPKVVDALALVDTAKDAVSGEWTLAGDGLEARRGRYLRIQLPLLPPSEYDFRVTFTRKSGDNALALIGSHGDRDFMGMLAGWTDRFVHLGEINALTIGRNPSRKDFNSRITNGKKHTAVLEVRKDGLRLLLDGELLTEWKTNYADMALDSEWKLRDRLSLGVGVFESRYILHEIKIYEIEGACRPLRGVTIKRN